MQNNAATLQCPNDLCKACNCQTDKFCQQCGTPLSKRYLWAVGELGVPSGDKGAGIEAYKLGDLVGTRYLIIGDVVAERYLLKRQRIFLDTKPGLSPETPAEISSAIKPYLRLVSYQMHVPQVHGLVTVGKGRNATQVLFLEQAPIYADDVTLEGQLMPELTDAWKDATSMRQLNWLWQIATLWQPLNTEGVASSLLDPQLLRVEGSLVRLLQLQLDRTCAPALSQIGQLWKSHLLSGAQGVIAEFLEQLCQHLIQGEVHSSQQLVAILDRGLAEVGRSQVRTLKISTCTNTGPSRQRNEDACYPPSGTTITKPPDREALAIICDGIGGHEGGSVASNLAIETIQQQVQKIPLDDALDPTTLINDLEKSACVANDRISERNDSEHRQGRQRMGTTLVMALTNAHEIYITHIGDSRAYWITRTGCHQITLDDDVASREVRLGYTLYSDALQHPSSGSLVQALGMSSSASLHPTVQRFILDEDCVFLLCSDGLSDYERVEQCWETEILPILNGKVDVANAVARLVEIANTQNGHDNVTVGLVYCQVSSFDPESTVNPSLITLATVSSASASPTAATVLEDAKTLPQLNTQLLPSQHIARRGVPMLLGLILLLSLGGGLLFYFGLPFHYLLKQWNLPRLSNVGSSPSVAPSPSSASLVPGALIRTKSEIAFNLIALRQDKAVASQPQQRFRAIKGIVPAGSVLQVLDKQPVLEQDPWLDLKVCSAPFTEPDKNNTSPNRENVQPSPTASNSNLGATASLLLQPGDKGRIQKTTIELLIFPVSSLEPAELLNCPALNEEGDKEFTEP
jgi:protein phosphatase